MIDMTPPIRSPRNGDIHFDIDVIDKCNLQCPTCFRGVGAQKNTQTAMPLDKFRSIVAKAHAEGYPNICLINWTEAFLLKNLDEYVSVVKEYPDLDCWISSNLSLPPDRYLPSILAALAAGVDILSISVSGWSQEVYEINHKKGRVDWIKENLDGIAASLRSGTVKSSVWVRYLEWPYNAHEKTEWQALATSYRIGFDAVPAHGDPLQPLPKQYPEHIRRVLEKAQPTQQVVEIIPDKVCGLIMDRAVIDAKGDAYLCCAFPNTPELRIGQYTELTEADLLLKRHTHSYCRSCQIPSRDATPHDRKRFQQALS